MRLRALSRDEGRQTHRAAQMPRGWGSDATKTSSEQEDQGFSQNSEAGRTRGVWS